jgi:hypothetical protein
LREDDERLIHQAFQRREKVFDLLARVHNHDGERRVGTNEMRAVNGLGIAEAFHSAKNGGARDPVHPAKVHYGLVEEPAVVFVRF